MCPHDTGSAARRFGVLVQRRRDQQQRTDDDNGGDGQQHVGHGRDAAVGVVLVIFVHG